MENIIGRALVTRNGQFLFPKAQELTSDELFGFIKWNSDKIQPRLRENMKMYLGEHPILKQAKKQFGPDNRLVVNKAKTIVDTFNGYFIGIPPSIQLDKGDSNDKLQDWLNSVSFIDKLNELSKQADIYGKSIGFVYQNEDSDTCFNYDSPTKAFIIYDDTVEREPLAFVRYEYFKNETEWQARGVIYYANYVYQFDRNQISSDVLPNPYKMVPAVEFYENEERQGVFEQVKSLICALDDGFSQKANQLAYFDMAYLVMMGINLQTDETGKPKIDIANNRFLYLPNVTPGSNPKVEFLSKPADDEMQENFIKRVSDAIYEVSMIPNLNDENFAGNSSGVALQFKLLAMQDKANSKERKFVQALKKLFKIIFSLGQVLPETDRDAWKDLQIHFTKNVPSDVAAMISAAKDADGLISQRTQMKLLPGIVDDPDDEIAEIQKEKAENIKNAQEAAGSLPDFMKQPGDVGDDDGQ